MQLGQSASLRANQAHKEAQKDRGPHKTTPSVTGKVAAFVDKIMFRWKEGRKERRNNEWG